MSTPFLAGNSKAQGFTLLEMLAAMGILTVMLALATLALNQFQMYGREEGAHFKRSLESSLRLNQLADLLEASFDYYVTDESGETHLLFEGSDDEMVFVSQRNWYHDNPESFNRLRVAPSITDPEKVALVLYAIGLDTVLLLDDDNLPESELMRFETLIDQAEAISFEYLGFSSLGQLLTTGVEKNAYRDLEWSSDYNGEETHFLPAKVRIRVQMNDIRTNYIIELPLMNLAKRSLMVGG